MENRKKAVVGKKSDLDNGNELKETKRILNRIDATLCKYFEAKKTIKEIKKPQVKMRCKLFELKSLLTSISHEKDHYDILEDLIIYYYPEYRKNTPGELTIENSASVIKRKRATSIKKGVVANKAQGKEKLKFSEVTVTIFESLKLRNDEEYVKRSKKQGNKILINIAQSLGIEILPLKNEREENKAISLIKERIQKTLNYQNSNSQQVKNNSGNKIPKNTSGNKRKRQRGKEI